MRDIHQCLVCGETSHDLRYPSTYSGGVDQAHRYFLAHREASAHGDIRRCRACGFMFTSPQFEPDEYNAIYSRVGEGGHAEVSPAEEAATRAASTARFQRLRGLVNELAPPDGAFLDFGCGVGDFLRVMDSPRGVGFEVGPSGSRAGPAGTTIIRGSWREVAGSARLPDTSQALVCAFDVFEHLPSLIDDLARIRQVLRRDGLLALTVPDAGSLMARCARGRWNMLLLEHLWYFNVRTLHRFMQSQGFAPVKHCSVPYDASLGHALRRFEDSTGLRLPFQHWLPRNQVVPVPAGVLFAAYRRQD